MGRKRSMMSDSFKEEIAKELGFYDKVQKDGWGGISGRDAGNMVKRAIQMAEEQMVKDRN
ncbi:small, acid-soluble spore protein, alpha/beta type [Halobacillus litoralis]|uniref:Small, acid-soluble spore protein, alpha/beta type n=1 Tax=Halobacillus litoralis TaxID=45668 RepID=A0A845DW98_9BACI|nr:MULTISPECIES: small, acid-soluble spore protein, alpha/beta type [Halobacillus]MCA1024420.1 alpha/beta-type small acid-soluble spore protein [Halobacillus litoralis]MYL21963.1 small, acid-soluble spore protein, alpha/beta type [Halobacillus litoralis]MYL31929.1 small, acid-soluble spore protein, alpha/beta type [Halobacillus halophilus]MYL39763.1 small, acid-soluble spore protein, alpha/beta type [Halobacillus litoralis]